ncbi:MULTISPECIES: DUF4468 domain-containing protein [unclassified Mucilaginibacter]|uniref:DUF4468 domain-containing protein n=1 Tax=unclassified Mucilaginibacter TaxID=2617802 RepID=UPI002AC8E33C|nr:MULTISPECIES: DUF4468 domain-containing protein [unclassified Mucilaginibacter]MEB0261280.1 DUF4468 domain-containing protein [Mucilaginibacter sp. 10I4]MEB0279104.1 DUF4468 domain-containing protein [Mucilaginibacter sp. 10B2]MEB0299877.1 DUF4468 domain-containing protein [Mucilaginibacter sp. 5C4]WPX22282.1 DUF4468 domain-containing protein [Mucilaginibacter sp. 5C4]
MKKIFFSLVCLFCVQVASAQKDSLAFDEGNNYIYYRVIDKPALNADTLYKRAWAFAAAFDRSAKPAKGQGENTLNTSGKLLVYTGVSLMRKEGGEISYTLNIQTKENRYRYRISNFVFKPYQRDRFGNMIPIPGVEVPLEKMEAKYGKKNTDNYLDQVAAFSINADAKLKIAMDKLPATVKTEPVKKISTQNW